MQRTWASFMHGWLQNHHIRFRNRLKSIATCRTAAFAFDITVSHRPGWGDGLASSQARCKIFQGLPGSKGLNSPPFCVDTTNSVSSTPNTYTPYHSIPLCGETCGRAVVLAHSHFRTLIERQAVLSGRSRSQESTYFPTAPGAMIRWALGDW